LADAVSQLGGAQIAREIRRMLARVGMKLKELERVGLGPLRTAGLKPGTAKLLGKRDVAKLREAVLSG
jgi:16S rRNA U516 pseudouridylate synthase RsuA-like enzyme